MRVLKLNSYLSSSRAAPFLLSTSLSVSPRVMLGDSGEESLSAITNSLTVTDVKPVFSKWAWQEIASQKFFLVWKWRR